MRCGAAKALDVDGEELAGKSDACLVAVHYVNSGAAPATFSAGTETEPGPASGVGYDSQGRRFDSFAWNQGEVNPGADGRTELVFAMPAGAKLVRIELGGASIRLG